MKDNFSTQANLYAQYRPVYPPDLYTYILSVVKNTGKAWDCGTGNGQVAAVLAESFDEVCATDISAKQLENAAQKPNIRYSLQAAEQTDFPGQYFDLIVVAQAIHWFRFDDFYKEVYRTLKPDGVIIVAGYGLMQINAEADKIVQHFYSDITGPYWDAERHYIDEEYKTIPFPFIEMDTPDLFIRLHWTLEHLLGYLSTWSAVQHYIKDKNENPVDGIKENLHRVWGGGIREVRFPVLLRAGKRTY